MIKLIINFISILKRKIRYKKTSYAFNGVDLIIEYIFKKEKKGINLDIGLSLIHISEPTKQEAIP